MVTLRTQPISHVQWNEENVGFDTHAVFLTLLSFLKERFDDNDVKS